MEFPVAMNKSKTSLKTTAEWKDTNWRKLERVCFKLQKRIYKASSRGDVKAVRRLQKTLMKSWSAKMLAVRRVTQDNRGKKTAGIDGIKSLTPNQRLTLVNQLRLDRKVKPTRRVWIPKPGTKEKRPLGIPTMQDRALQALVKLALEPEWEAKFEPNSYGFRPGRSCHDAREAIFKAICQKSKYVLDADIAKCFDRINHHALLEKINTFPAIRRQVRAWLKAGVIDEGVFQETKEGTPQGGVISPLLANIALHGMEERIKRAFPRKTRKINGKKVDIPPPDVIRYADDLVIMHPDLTTVEQAQQVLTEWLKDMGLELKPEKTRIAHTLNEHEGNQPGFNFLGFTVRQFPVGKYRSGKSSNGQILGFKTIIRPQEKKIQHHSEELAKVIRANTGTTQEVLIHHLQSKIRGWANYYSTASSAEAFDRLSHELFQKLRAWGNRRHPNKSSEWISRKYWQTVGADHWVFATRNDKGEPTVMLKTHSKYPSGKTHVKVKENRSPYDGDWVYWSTRMGRHPEAPKRVSELLERQKGKCAHCGMFFKDGDRMEIDHKIPKSKGGRNIKENLQLLHGHCHDKKTAQDYKTYAVGNKELEIDYDEYPF